MSYYYQNINHFNRIIKRNTLYTQEEAIEYLEEYFGKSDNNSSLSIALLIAKMTKEHSSSGSKFSRLEKSIILESQQKVKNEFVFQFTREYDIYYNIRVHGEYTELYIEGNSTRFPIKNGYTLPTLTLHHSRMFIIIVSEKPTIQLTYEGVQLENLYRKKLVLNPILDLENSLIYANGCVNRIGEKYINGFDYSLRDIDITHVEKAVISYKQRKRKKLFDVLSKELPTGFPRDIIRHIIIPYVL